MPGKEDCHFMGEGASTGRGGARALPKETGRRHSTMGGTSHDMGSSSEDVSSSWREGGSRSAEGNFFSLSGKGRGRLRNEGVFTKTWSLNNPWGEGGGSFRVRPLRNSGKAEREFVARLDEEKKGEKTWRLSLRGRDGAPCFPIQRKGGDVG